LSVRPLTTVADAGLGSIVQSRAIQDFRKEPKETGKVQIRLQRERTRRILLEGEIQGKKPNPETMDYSSEADDLETNLGRIKCVVDVGENSIEIDPYVADFFFEPIFLSERFPD